MFLFKRNNIYYIQYFDEYENRYKRKSTKTSRKNEALKFLTKFEQQIKSTTSNNLNITISEFEEEYVNFMQESKSPKYLKSIKLSFRMLIDHIGNKKMRKINVKDIESFISNTYRRARYSATLYYRTLKAAFSKAITWNYISENPFKKVKVPKTPISYPLFIGKEEFLKILSQIEKDLIKDIIIVAFYTGLRAGEITNMKWSWIDIESRLITVKNDKDYITKSKRERIIPMSKIVYKLFKKKHLANRVSSYESFVFTRNNTKLNEDYISKQFKKAVREAKLDDRIHFHTLRHSFASMLVQKDVSLYIVKELMGHQSISTTQIYVHLKNKELGYAISTLDEDF